MAWIESHDDLATHPKTRRAARTLGISIPTMMGHLHLLWHWCLKYADDGDLSGYDSADIADAMMWEGDPDELVEALVNCGPGDRFGFLEHADGAALVVHDWLDYAGKLIEKREEAREAGARGNHERWHVRRGIIDPDCPFCQEGEGENAGPQGSDPDPIGGRSGGESSPDRVLSHRTVPYLTIEEEEEDAPARETAQAKPKHEHDKESLDLAFRVFGGVGPTQLDILDDMVSATGPEVAREALRETERYATGNKTRYCEKVIKDWASRGIKTPEDLAVYRAHYESSTREGQPRGDPRGPGKKMTYLERELREAGVL
jgi:hypothetical protein